jgi:plastocyanin
MSSPRRSRSLALVATALAALLLAFAYSNCSKKEDAQAPSAGAPAAQAPAAPTGTEAPPSAGSASGGTPAEPPGKVVAMAEKTDKASTAAMPGTVAVGRGNGSIAGEVTLTGAPPEMQPLKRGVDPVCAKKPMNDEQVLSKGGKLENVVVWVSKGAPAAAAPTTQAKLQQMDCMYRPRVQAVQEGQTLSVHNADGTLHNVRAVRDGKTLFNKAQLPGGPDIAQAIGAGNVLQFKCDVHPWMKAYAVVVPSGYSAVTGPDGKFVLDGLPPGQYTVSAWHELFGTKTTEVTLTDADRKATPILFSFNVQDRE